MEINQIKELAELMKKTGLTAVEIKEDDKGYVRLERIQPSPAVLPSPVAVPPAVPEAVPSTRDAQPEEELKPAQAGHIITSPTVGVFYTSPSPESDPYVQLGDQVKIGDVLCIIEAMKLMNEIQSEADGRIAEIYVGNGQVVEYGQPLFRIE